MEKVRIKNFTEVITGGTPSTSKSEFWENGNIPWLNSGELNQKIVTSSRNYITKLGLEKSSSRLMPKDTVLIALTGSTTGVVGYLTFEACANQSVTGILPSENHNSKYLYYYLNSIRPKVLSDAYGGAQPHISQGYVKELEIPLPPLATQQRIATILDQADAIIQNNRDIVQKYDALTQSLFLDMFGDPVKNEKGWETDKVVNVCSKIFGGGTPSKGKPEYFIGNIPWVTPKDMKSEYIYDSIDHINLKAIENSSAKLIPSGNLLMVIRSGILKHTLPLAINRVDVTVNQDMKAFIPNTGKTNTIFLKYFFQCSSGYILGKVRAVTADNIEFNQIKELSFPLVPITLQNQFAERVAVIEAQKLQAQEVLAKSEALFQSLLQRAFKGELN